MDPAGLIDELFQAVVNIDFGRKGLITKAMEAFEEAQTTADPKTLVLAEYTFLEQEFAFCYETDIDTRSSLSQAIQNFNDALLSLEAVEDAGVPNRTDSAQKGVIGVPNRNNLGGVIKWLKRKKYLLG
jgi:hypothetical protein